MRGFPLYACLAAGLAGLVLCGRASADFPGSPCRTQHVRAPAPRVIVELSEPEVIINDVCGETVSRSKEKHCLFRKHHRVHSREGRPVFATVMTPAQVGLGCAPNRQQHALGVMQAVYELEMQEAVRNYARSIEDAEAKVALGSMERTLKTMGTRLGSTAAGAGAADLEAKLDKLAGKVDEIEALLKKHDNYLRSEILKREVK